MINNDLELMWSIQNFCHHSYYASRIEKFMDSIVSKYPWRDIVLVLWVAFLACLMELGSRHFWVAAMNYAFAATLRRLVEAKRPVEFDVRLQPLTDSGAESYGFPSLESYMCVVVLGHMCLSMGSLWLVLGSVALTLLIGFSRVYSQARFPHQILGSWILGGVGLLVSLMNHEDHGFCVGFMVACLAIPFGLSMENNDSRLLCIPKESGNETAGTRADQPNLNSNSRVNPNANPNPNLDGQGEADNGSSDDKQVRATRTQFSWVEQEEEEEDDDGRSRGDGDEGDGDDDEDRFADMEK
eukprot:gene34200-44183_t